MFRFIVSVLAAATLLAHASIGALAAPPLWQLSDEDNRIWLFGSIHALPRGTEWRTELLDRVMGEAELYYYEAPVTDQARAGAQATLISLGYNPPGERLTSYLHDDDASLLVRLAQGYGLPLANIEPMRPWLASLTLTVLAMQAEGFDMEAGVEVTLQPQTPDVRERFFETPAEQYHFVADLPQHVQVAVLAGTLREIVDNPDVFKSMADAWQAGDVEGLAHVLEDLEVKDYPEVREALIVNRNKAWVEEIVAMMDDGDDVLIVVGAGHLVGADNVLDLLAARGFAAERIQ